MVAAGLDFPGRRLDEIRAGTHRDLAGDADVVVGLEFAGFEDHFQVRVAAGFLDGGNFVRDALVVAGEEDTAVDHHVDLIRAVARGAADFLQLQPQRHQTAGKTGGNGGDFHAGIAEELFRRANQIWINANGGAGRHVVAQIGRLHRLAAEERHLPGRVFSFQGRQVHHRDGELQARKLRRGLDAPLGESGGAFLDHDLVDGGKFPSAGGGRGAVGAGRDCFHAAGEGRTLRGADLRNQRKAWPP